MIEQFRGEYGWLSNFASVDILYKGFLYQSTERAYQSEKCDDYTWKIFCSNPINNQGLIKQQSRTVQLIENWDERRVPIMLKLQRLKYQQPFYREKLIATGELYIQEGNWHNDDFWGFCFKKQSGENMLGRLIMQVREEINSGFL